MSTAWTWLGLWGIVQVNFYIWLKLWVPHWNISKPLRSELWWTTAFIAWPIQFAQSTWDTIDGGNVGDWIFYAIFAPINVILWYFFILKDKDRDDRWKKRRKKALSKVKQIAGRLVVVPIPAPGAA